MTLQEGRWKWLQQYHQWLQTQTKSLYNNNYNSDSNGNNNDNDNDSDVFYSKELYHRVCLMEASILLQADELQRIQKLFLEVIFSPHFY